MQLQTRLSSLSADQRGEMTEGVWRIAFSKPPSSEPDSSSRNDWRACCLQIDIRLRLH